jgi:hypothetical protein
MEDVADGTFERRQRLQLVCTRDPRSTRDGVALLRDPSHGILDGRMQRWRIDMKSGRIWGYLTLVPVEVEPRLGVHTRIPMHYRLVSAAGADSGVRPQRFVPMSASDTRRLWRTGLSRSYSV